MDKALLAAIAEELQAAKNILVTCHLRPDGDAIGSLLGLGLSLKSAGKQVQMVSVDGVPASYRFLAGSEQISSVRRGAVDFTIVVDCSDIRRTGNALDGCPPPDLNIDHHITNELFARLNLVDTQAVATAEVIARLLPLLGLPLDRPAAASLLTGIVTDTLGFRTTNTTPAALRLSADLMDFGLDLVEIYERTLVQRSYEATRFWSAGLNRIERLNGVVWTSLTLADRKTAGYPGKDDADLINVLSAIQGIQVALVFVEQTRQRVKVSWRSRPGVDVSSLARAYGGGGHPAAAGAEIDGSLEQVVGQVVEDTLLLLQPEGSLQAAG